MNAPQSCVVSPHAHIEHEPESMRCPCAIKKSFPRKARSFQNGIIVDVELWSRGCIPVSVSSLPQMGTSLSLLAIHLPFRLHSLGRPPLVWAFSTRHLVSYACCARAIAHISPRSASGIARSRTSNLGSCKCWRWGDADGGIHQNGSHCFGCLAALTFSSLQYFLQRPGVINFLYFRATRYHGKTTHVRECT